MQPTAALGTCQRSGYEPAPAVDRRPIVGVLGCGQTGNEQVARPLGEWLANQAVHLFIVAGGGVMESVSRAFVSVKGREGLILGVIPADETALKCGEIKPREGHQIPCVEIAVRTHLWKLDEDDESINHISALTPDVIVALRGDSMVESQVKLASRYGTPVIVYVAKDDALDWTEGLDLEVAHDMERVMALVLERVGGDKGPLEEPHARGPRDTCTCMGEEDYGIQTARPGIGASAEVEAEGCNEGAAAPAEVHRRAIVGVMGSGDLEHEHLAGPIGQWLATQGVHLLTGGGRGVMTSVSRAFTSVSGREGVSIGIIPADQAALLRGEIRPKPHYPNPFVEVAVRTHLCKSSEDRESRNHINTLTPDVIVALPGETGTASEVNLAKRYGTPVIAWAGAEDPHVWIEEVKAFVQEHLRPLRAHKEAGRCGADLWSQGACRGADRGVQRR